MNTASRQVHIFLSYGQDANQELVRRIKADLEKRGHDVWFDKNPEKQKGITPGDNWRRAITDDILKSNRALSFLSKHSTRDPGVCRDEIAIAIGVKGGNIQTILVESQQEVQPPVNIGHIRVFLSSTFSDLKAERNGLQERVFPRLKRYCERRGWSFQAIDLRWGTCRMPNYECGMQNGRQ